MTALDPVAETLLTPLWARAHATEIAPDLATQVPGLELVAEHDVMERLGAPQRATAKAFRLATRGGRMYHVAQLRVLGSV